MGDYSDAERAKFPKSAFCDPEHEAYPVLDAEDAAKAWLSRGRAQIDPDKIAACVVRKVRAHADWPRADLPQSLLDALKGDGKGADCSDCEADALLDALTSPRPVEYKALTGPVAQLKILGPDDPGGSQHGMLSGYAAIFNNFDRTAFTPESIQPGAFIATIPDFLHMGFAAWGHDWSRPIATPIKAVEDEIGLFTISEFHSTADAQDARTIARERLERGKGMGLSIGYGVDADEMVTREDTKAPGRLLKALTLYEFSLVTVPANPLALATGVKGGPPAGLAYAAEAEAVLAAVKAFVARTQALSALRAKEGRALSAASRDKLTAVRDALAAHRDALGTHADEMDSLYATLDTMLTPYEEPPPADKTARLDPARLRALHLDFLRLEARRLGVNV